MLIDKKPLNIGLVGCGAWGKNILRDLLSLGCHVLVADIDKDARRRALERGAKKVFAHSDELPTCDAYVVAVPIPDLAPVCKSLLKNKKPIFAEKTLCLSMADADDLESAGGKNYVFAMHKWHYHPGIEALRVVAQSGRIGKLEEMFCTRHGWVDDFHGGDVFWTLAVHDLTIVKHILGYLPDTIKYAKAIKNEQGLPISLTAILGEDPAANISVNARHARKISGVSIHGTRGTAMLNNSYDDHIIVNDNNGEARITIDTTFPLYLELAEFVSYLKGGPRPRCGLESAREVTRALLDLREQAMPDKT